MKRVYHRVVLPQMRFDLIWLGCVLFFFLSSAPIVNAATLPYLWTADGVSVQKIASDGSKILKLESLNSISMNIDHNEGVIWMISYPSEILKYDMDGKELLRIESTIAKPQFILADSQENKSLSLLIRRKTDSISGKRLY